MKIMSLRMNKNIKFYFDYFNKDRSLTFNEAFQKYLSCDIDVNYNYSSSRIFKIIETDIKGINKTVNLKISESDYNLIQKGKLNRTQFIEAILYYYYKEVKSKNSNNDIIEFNIKNEKGIEICLKIPKSIENYKEYFNCINQLMNI